MRHVYILFISLVVEINKYKKYLLDRKTQKERKHKGRVKQHTINYETEIASMHGEVRKF